MKQTVLVDVTFLSEIGTNCMLGVLVVDTDKGYIYRVAHVEDMGPKLGEKVLLCGLNTDQVKTVWPRQEHHKAWLYLPEGGPIWTLEDIEMAEDE